MFKREIALSFDFRYYAKPRIPIVKWDKLGRKWDELLAGQVQENWRICRCGRLGFLEGFSAGNVHFMNCQWFALAELAQTNDKITPSGVC